MGSINFADSADIRKAHKSLMSQVGTESTHIGNKYKIQIEPVQFQWDKFLPTLEKDFQEILNEVLSHSNQQQLPKSNKDRSAPNENRNQYNTGIDSRARTLTTPSPTTMHPNRAHRFKHMSHSTPNTTNMYGGNGYLTKCTYQETQNRRHTYHITQHHLDHEIQIMTN